MPFLRSRAISSITLSIILLAGAAGMAGAGGIFAPPAAEVESIVPPAQYLWYSVKSGIPVPVDPGTFVTGGVMREPWTVRPHVSAIVQHSGGIYIGINGSGVAALDPAALDAPMRLLRDPSLFGGRVLEQLFTFEGRLYCHIYRNTALDTKPPQGPPTALLEIAIREDGMSPSRIPLPFQREHPDWEAVELLPLAEDEWHASWKRSGETVEFGYRRFAFPGESGRDVSREEVAAAYRYRDIRQAPVPVWELFTEIADRSGGETVVHLTVNSPDATSPERYRAGSRTSLERGRANLVAMNMFRTGGTYVLLTAEGSVYIRDTDGAVSRLVLPRLPGGFVYTELWTDGTDLIVGWEEQDFLYVGEAGYMIARAFR